MVPKPDGQGERAQAPRRSAVGARTMVACDSPMDVVSLAPVPVSSLAWRIGDGRWSLAVVCKLTFLLRPGECALAKRQEPVHASDLRTSELPADRILVPGDLVPGRSLVDVTAYVPAPDPSGRRGDHRIAVGSIDRRVAASERIAVEFAGHAAGSPERPGRLPESGDEITLPEHVDWSVFNAAPRDLRLTELAPDAELQLERMHPDHVVLVTRLPNACPQAFVERDGRRHEVPMIADGLWFDGRRGLACVTYRAQIPLVERHERGKVFVAVGGPNRRVSEATFADLVTQLRGGASVPGARASTPGRPAGRKDEGEHTVRRRKAQDATSTSVLGALQDEHTVASVLSRADAGPAWLRREPGAARPSQPPPAADPTSAPPSSSLPFTAALGGASAGGMAPPPSVRDRAVTGPFPAASARPPGGEGPALSAPGSIPASPSTPAPANAAPLPVPPPRAVLSSNTGVAPPPNASPWSRGRPDVEPLAPVEVPAQEPPREVPRALEMPKRPAREAVELLWFDADATAKVRRRFPAAAQALEFEPLDPEHDLATDDAARARDHHTHFGLVTTLPPLSTGEIRERLRESVSETGRFTAPLVATAGELGFPFDTVELLRATAGAMAPLVGEDRRLAEALGPVDELLASPLAGASFEPVQKLLDHLRRVFRETRRTVTLEQLDDIVTRSLLEQRKYQRRKLLGGTFVRALLTTTGSREAVPCYLPDALSAELPMMTSFRARLLAEALVRVDQYEPSRLALRIVTLGRLVEV